MFEDDSGHFVALDQLLREQIHQNKNMDYQEKIRCLFSVFLVFVFTKILYSIFDIIQFNVFTYVAKYLPRLNLRMLFRCLLFILWHFHAIFRWIFEGIHRNVTRLLQIRWCILVMDWLWVFRKPRLRFLLQLWYF